MVQDTPAPGAYEADLSYDRTQGKINPGCPRTEEARRRMGAFKQSTCRFAPPRDIVIAEPDPFNPGNI